MTNNRVRDLAPEIKHILEEYPNTRNSDTELYTVYLIRHNIAPHKNTILFLFYLMDNKVVASFESVSRCRRKAQELYPELRATEEVETARIDNQMSYEDFAQDKRI